MRDLAFATLLLALLACDPPESSDSCASKGAIVGEHGLCVCPQGFVAQSAPERCVPLQGSPDAAVERPSSDASSPGLEAGHDSSRDAPTEPMKDEQDAAAVLDAGHATDGPPDAAAKSSDAGDASVERADASFVCNPRGAWFATLTEYTGGTCGSPTPGVNPMPVEIDFGDTLQTALTTPNCAVVAQPTADGCQVVYDQMCTFADAPGVTEREMGTWTMTSPGEIVGVSEVVRTDGTGKVLCTSKMNLHAIAQ